MEKVRPRSPRWTWGLFGLVLLLLYWPIFYLVWGSFVQKSGSEWSWTLRWYREVFVDHQLQAALGRSVVVALISSAVATFLGSAAAIALQRSRFAGKKLLQTISLISLVMPELVFALSLLSWFFVLQWQLSLTTVIAAHVTFSLSFVLLVVTSRLSAMDSSIEEAAFDLGASDWQVLLRVIMPLILPAVGAAYILCFLLSFDDFLITFFTSGVGSDTLPIKLYSAMRLGHSPKLNALSTLLILFTSIMIYLVMRSRSIRNLFTNQSAK